MEEEPVQVHSSPIRKEVATFGGIQQDLKVLYWMTVAYGRDHHSHKIASSFHTRLSATTSVIFSDMVLSYKEKDGDDGKIQQAISSKSIASAYTLGSTHSVSVGISMDMNTNIEFPSRIVI